MGVRKVYPQYRPYSNCVTLKGQLVNWTSEDIIKVAKDNIETIIEPVKDDLEEQTIWNQVEASDNLTNNGILEFGSIGDSFEEDSDNKDDDYEWNVL